MTKQTWTLQDAARNVFVEQFQFNETIRHPVTKNEKMVRISKRRLQGGLSDGVDIVEIDNGQLSLSVIPTRGMGIWRGQCGDVQLKWNSPNPGPVHPSWVPIHDPGGLGWLEGFDEWLVRCGLESNGSPEFDPQGRLVHPLHGRIANLPARELSLSVDTESGEISLTGKVYETKLFFKKLLLESTITTSVGSSSFTVTDRITNLSDHPGEFELLYHINTGLPFAEPGSRFHIPFECMAPRAASAVANLDSWNIICPETPESEEVVFFFEPAVDQAGRCKTMLANPRGDRAISLSFARNEFPYFSFWKSRLSDADGFVCGLEPAVNFPNNKSFEKQHGRVETIQPRQTRQFELRFDILHDSTSVEERKREIENTPGNRTILPNPREQWTP